VVDGFTRVRCLKKLKSEHGPRDGLAALRSGLAHPRAAHAPRGKAATPLNTGGCCASCSCGPDRRPARRSSRDASPRSKAWVCLRLALVEELPEEIQQRVRCGQIAPYAAMKYLVPFARANRVACLGLVSALRHTRRRASAAGGALPRVGLQATSSPASGYWPTLGSSSKRRKSSSATGPLEKPPARLLLGGSGGDRGHQPADQCPSSGRDRPAAHGAEKSEVTLCLAQAKADTETVFHLFEKELADARPGPAPSHP